MEFTWPQGEIAMPTTVPCPTISVFLSSVSFCLCQSAFSSGCQLFFVYRCPCLCLLTSCLPVSLSLCNSFGFVCFTVSMCPSVSLSACLPGCPLACIPPLPMSAVSVCMLMILLVVFLLFWLFLSLLVYVCVCLYQVVCWFHSDCTCVSLLLADSISVRIAGSVYVSKSLPVSVPLVAPVCKWKAHTCSSCERETC